MTRARIRGRNGEDVHGGEGELHDDRGRRAARCGSPTRTRSSSRKPGFTKLDLAEYYLAVAEAAVNQLRERPGTMKRFVDGVERRVLLPEAGAEGRAGLAADRDLHLPERAHRDRARRQRRRAPRLGGQPRGGRLQPASGPPRRPRPPRRAAGRPRPDARGSLEHGPQGGDVRPGGARGARAGRLSRRPRARAASTSTCGSSRAGTTSRCAGRRWRWPARSSAALPRNATSKWWKEERHGVFVDYNQNARDRTIASGYSVRPVARRARLLPARVGRGARRRARRAAARHRPGPAREEGRPGGGHRRRTPARSTSCSTSPAATRRGPRRRALAAALRQAARRAEAGAAVASA